MGSKNPFGNFLKTTLLIGVGIGIFSLGMIYFTIQNSGQSELINQMLGNYFWYAIIGFIVFIISLIYVLQRWVLSSFKPKDIPNGLPATAKVIKSYQGNMRVTIGGVNQNYELIIEVEVTNPYGEIWQTKMNEMVNITPIGMFIPGMRFPVKYDPDDKYKVVFDQGQQQETSYGNTTGASQHDAHLFSNIQNFQGQSSTFHSMNIPGFGTIDSNMAQQAKMNHPEDIVLRLQLNSILLNELNASGNGVSSEATIVSNALLIESYMNGFDAYQLRVKVNISDFQTIESDISILVQKSSSFKIKAGKTVYVKYDSNNPQRVALTGLDHPDNTIAL